MSGEPGEGSSSARISALRERLVEAMALKRQPRVGWARAGVSPPESVADHTWGVAWLVLALCPEGIDRGRALAIAVIHDLAEARVGDITPHDNVPKAEKHRLEAAAFRDLVSPLPHRGELESLWMEYETRSSPEGRFVKACDKLEMALQAQIYARDAGVETAEFVESALDALDDPLLEALAGGGAL